MLVPFILAPVVLTLISTFATWTGLVPVVTQSVDWTVPIIVSGYKATGSVAGSLLQIFNIFVGVLIYMPFIRRGELKETNLFKEAIWQMERDMAAGEKNGHIPRFLNRESSTSITPRPLPWICITPCGAGRYSYSTSSDYRAGYAAWG